MQVKVSNVAYLLRAFSDFAQRAGQRVLSLGDVGGFPLVLSVPQRAVRDQPSVLIAAGFHGEEPAGCWGLLALLRRRPDLLRGINVSFLPAVNPTGLARNQRLNWMGENPNRGFGISRDDDGSEVSVSVEGELLLSRIDLLTAAAQDGFLTLHEDEAKEGFFLYSFEHTDEPAKFTDTLVRAGTAFFPPMPDGRIEGDRVNDATIFNLDDGSFESHLFYRCGVACAACTETPGKADLAMRVKANAALLASFLDFVRRQK